MKTRVVSQLQEYPGSTIWQTNELLCPLCEEWKLDWGNVDVDIHGNGYFEPVCTQCGDKEIANEK